MYLSVHIYTQNFFLLLYWVHILTCILKGHWNYHLGILTHPWLTLMIVKSLTLPSCLPLDLLVVTQSVTGVWGSKPRWPVSLPLWYVHPKIVDHWSWSCRFKSVVKWWSGLLLFFLGRRLVSMSPTCSVVIGTTIIIPK